MTRTPFLSSLSLIPLLLAGCGGGGDGDLIIESDYALQIVPHALQGQEPFASGNELELVIVPDGGNAEIFYLGAIEGGQVQAESFPPIPEGATVGLLVESPGGEPGVYDEDLVVAWGASPIAEALGTGGVQATLDLLVAEVGAVGDLGVNSSARVRFGAGVAMTREGSVYLFGGGTDSNNPSDTTDKILKLDDIDTGAWGFEKIDTNIPSYDGLGSRYGLAAAVIDDAGQELIFVTGGRDDPGTVPSNSTNGAFLFDPATDTVVWGDKASHDRMFYGRSEHEMLVMDNGRVLIYSGWIGGNLDASIEVFNPANRKFEFSDAVTIGEVEVAAASMGSEGAIVCGGGNLSSQTSDTTPTKACDYVNLQGLVTPGPDLPDAAMSLAMARLADGRVLATGGIHQTVANLERVPAESSAWILENGSWSPLSASMNSPRAHHAIVPLPNGDAIVVGGTSEGGPVFAQAGPAEPCPEYFDSVANAFLPMSPCTNSGAGAAPGVSIQPDRGAFILAGEDLAPGQEQLGDAYGFIGFPPTL